jgi:hypothetical protein
MRSDPSESLLLFNLFHSACQEGDEPCTAACACAPRQARFAEQGFSHVGKDEKLVLLVIHGGLVKSATEALPKGKHRQASEEKRKDHTHSSETLGWREDISGNQAHEPPRKVGHHTREGGEESTRVCREVKRVRHMTGGVVTL